MAGENIGIRDICNEQHQSYACALCGEVKGLLLCGGCRTVWYCNKEHQKTHWTVHRTFCRAKIGDSTNVNKPNSLSTSTAAKTSLETVSNTSNSLTSKSETYSDQTETFPMKDTKTITGQKTMIDTKAAVHSDREEAVTKLADYVVSCLKNYGLCVVDRFMGDRRGNQLLSEVQSLYTNGKFQDGQLASNVDNSRSKVRGDKIIWVEKSDKGCDMISVLIARLDTLILACTGRLDSYTINGRTKAMVAVYPGDGRGYMRHIDNPNKDGRCVTAIYYLNKDWNKETDGGVLRIFPQIFNQKVADIEPKFDRLIFFWSDRRNPHEVQPPLRERYAITVWYFDAVERAQAKERYRLQGVAEKGSMPRTESVPLLNEASEEKPSLTPSSSSSSNSSEEPNV